MILHLALPDDWERAKSSGQYGISTRGATIQEVGFLHACLDEDQAHRVDDFLYRDVPDLVCLRLAEEELAIAGHTVRLEPGDPEDPSSERFPHVYGGPIGIEHITPGPWSRP